MSLSDETPQAILNDLVREAMSAQDGFDNWDGGETYYDGGLCSRPRACTLDQVCAELDAANLKLVEHVVAYADDLRSALAAGSRRAKTPQAVECEASQSGPKGNAQ